MVFPWHSSFAVTPVLELVCPWLLRLSPSLEHFLLSPPSSRSSVYWSLRCLCGHFRLDSTPVLQTIVPLTTTRHTFIDAVPLSQNKKVIQGTRYSRLSFTVRHSSLVHFPHNHVRRNLLSFRLGHSLFTETENREKQTEFHYINGVWRVPSFTEGARIRFRFGILFPSPAVTLTNTTIKKHQLSIALLTKVQRVCTYLFDYKTTSNRKKGLL